jgi:hypothetical protein
LSIQEQNHLEGNETTQQAQNEPDCFTAAPSGTAARSVPAARELARNHHSRIQTTHFRSRKSLPKPCFRSILVCKLPRPIKATGFAVLDM